MAIRKLKNYKHTKFMAKTIHYDKDAAEYTASFIESLRHTKSTWEEKYFSEKQHLLKHLQSNF